MALMTPADFTALDRAGLNLHAVIDLDALPAEMLAGLRRSHDPEHRYRQLILIGHAGKTLWRALKASGSRPENPIDEFSVHTVEQWFATHFAGQAHAVIYPGDGAVGLQALGKIAGWHHTSPMMIGIQKIWGTWYAYRVVLLADTDLEATKPVQSESPCDRCTEKACIAACPAGALAGGAFDLIKCISYRKASSSRCQATCVARVSCPVGIEHRYDAEQLQHTYSISLKAIIDSAAR
jgi:ferredoxin